MNKLLLAAIASTLIFIGCHRSDAQIKVDEARKRLRESTEKLDDANQKLEAALDEFIEKYGD